MGHVLKSFGFCLIIYAHCVRILLCKIAEVFENVTENKLIYTSIFSEYTNLIGTNPTHIPECESLKMRYEIST